MNSLKSIALATLIAATTISNLDAATMSISFQDTASGLLVSYDGSVDTTGLSISATTTNGSPAIGLGGGVLGVSNFVFEGERTPFQAATFVGSTVAEPDIISFFATATLSPTAGLGVGSGDIFRFTMNREGFFGYTLSDNYISGTNISGSATFASLTVADFGDLPGALDGPSNNVALSAQNTLGFSASTAVPEPSFGMLLGLGGLAMGFGRRRPAA